MRPIVSMLSDAKPRRILALIRKEGRQVLRDPSSLVIGVALPLLLILLFGYAMSLDVRNMPIAVVAEDSSARASEVAAIQDGNRGAASRRRVESRRDRRPPHVPHGFLRCAWLGPSVPVDDFEPWELARLLVSSSCSA